MLQVIDIGNTNITLGLYDGQWIEIWRMETGVQQSAEANLKTLKAALSKHKRTAKEVRQAIISSVVPALTKKWEEACRQLYGVEPLVLSHTTDAGIHFETGRPEEIGPDLIADAAGAYFRFLDDCLVIDFGTATTIQKVEKPGIVKGGVICAGLEITAKALADRTALLPDIQLAPPEQVLGRNTVEAMQSGLVLGHLCMVEGLAKRLQQESGPSRVIATGGLAEVLAPYTKIFDEVDPLLTLEGLRIIAERQ